MLRPATRPRIEMRLGARTSPRALRLDQTRQIQKCSSSWGHKVHAAGAGRAQVSGGAIAVARMGAVACHIAERVVELVISS